MPPPSAHFASPTFMSTHPHFTKSYVWRQTRCLKYGWRKVCFPVSQLYVSEVVMLQAVSKGTVLLG